MLVKTTVNGFSGYCGEIVSIDMPLILGHKDELYIIGDATHLSGGLVVSKFQEYDKLLTEEATSEPSAGVAASRVSLVEHGKVYIWEHHNRYSSILPHKKVIGATIMYVAEGLAQVFVTYEA